MIALRHLSVVATKYAVVIGSLHADAQWIDERTMA
jgi:hypothetical protein